MAGASHKPLRSIGAGVVSVGAAKRLPRRQSVDGLQVFESDDRLGPFNAVLAATAIQRRWAMASPIGCSEM